MPIFTKVNGTWKAADSSVPIASSSNYGIVKSGSTVTNTTGLTACPIIGGIPYYDNKEFAYSIDTVHFSVYNSSNNGGYSGPDLRFNQIVVCGFEPRLVLQLPVNGVFVQLGNNFYPDSDITGYGEIKITTNPTGYTATFTGGYRGDLRSFSRRFIAFK